MTLRRIILPCLLCAALLAAAAQPAAAAKSDVRVSLDSRGLLFAASIVNVPVTVTCPPGSTGFVRLNVSQAAPGTSGSGDFFIPGCTGRPVTQVVSAFASTGIFILAKAHADVTAFVGPSTATAARDISIILF